MDLRDHHSLTPLHLSASRCCIKILSMMTLFLHRGRAELVGILLAGGANPNMRTGPPQKTPLQLAAAGGHVKVMEMLVKHGANWKDKDDWGWTVLHETAATGQLEGIHWVLKESKGLVNVEDKLGRGPLLVGLMAGAGVEVVKELLSQGEDPGQEDEVGRGCPEAAVLYCGPDVIRYILEFCINSDPKPEVNRELLLEIAEDHSQCEQVKDIIMELTK